jgi:hypothetical protein
MLNVNHLEIHVAHACNLRCESCSHYSDQGHGGIVALAEADRWMAAWSQRLQPVTFSLVGGEPALHPRLSEFVRIARRHWPDAFLRIVTNGFFLHRHPELPRVLQGDPKAHIYLSIHHRSPEYLQLLRPNYRLLGEWARTYGLHVSLYDSVKLWRRSYRGSGAAMQPYADGDPRRSWETCLSRGCPQLFEARLWKCAQLAYLGMQHARHPLAPPWQPYLAYRPLEPGCSDAELAAFFAREEEPFCGMCPATPEHFELPCPLPRRREAHAGGDRAGAGTQGEAPAGR